MLRPASSSDEPGWTNTVVEGIARPAKPSPVFRSKAPETIGNIAAGASRNAQDFVPMGFDKNNAGVHHAGTFRLHPKCGEKRHDSGLAPANGGNLNRHNARPAWSHYLLREIFRADGRKWCVPAGPPAKSRRPERAMRALRPIRKSLTVTRPAILSESSRTTNRQTSPRWSHTRLDEKAWPISRRWGRRTSHRACSTAGRGTAKTRGLSRILGSSQQSA